MQVIHAKDLGPKFFSLGLILVISSLPASILGVNIIQKFYFQPDQYLFYSIPRTAYMLFIIGYLFLFLIFGLFIYMKDSKTTVKLVTLCGLLFVLSILFCFLAFTNYSYISKNGLYINHALNFDKEETVPWSDISKVTQINKVGTPYQLEFHIVNEEPYVFHLQSDWPMNRRFFYQLLREKDIYLESKES